VLEAIPTERVALIRAKKSGEWQCLKFTVEPDAPHTIEMLRLGRAEAPSDTKAAEPLPPLDDAARRNVIDQLVHELHRNYVFPDKAQAIERELRASQGRQDYDKLQGRLAFGRAINQVMRRLSNDRHLRIDVSCSSSPESPRPAGAPKRQSIIGETRRLDGNIAYVEIPTFGDQLQPMTDEIRDAMSAAADASAIIFDVRKNGGGHEQNSQLLTSYLFGDAPVHLGSIYRRPTNQTEELFTNPRVPGTKLGPEKPVYIVTSRFTFSAPEGFAYSLQALKRAVIVGEVTGGGANPGDVVFLPHGFSAFIPNGRSINPITKTNWDGVGVKPDVEVSADEALATAHKLARARVASGGGR